MRVRLLGSFAAGMRVALTVAFAGAFTVTFLAACGGSNKNVATPQGADAIGGAGAGTGATPSPSGVPTGTSIAAPTAAQDAGAATTTDAIPADAGAGQKLATKDDGGAAGAPTRTAAPGRSVKDIQAIILARRDQARKCYDDALKDHPGIEGSLVIQWTIDPKGSVSKISIDQSRSAITEPSVGACIIEIIRKIQFAEHPQGKETETYYPFDFHPHTYGKK